MSPLYSYECTCSALKSDMRKIDERHDGPTCRCGKKMTLRIEPPAAIVKNPAVPRGNAHQG